jgi:hypothetical protein
LRGFFDGSVQGHKAAYGWVVLALRPGGEDSAKDWTQVASKSGTLPDGASITAAELTGVTCLISFLQSYYTSYKSALTNIKGTNSLDHNRIQMLALAELL